MQLYALQAAIRFSLQVDRLSVAALFDRNSTLFSSIFDILFAAFIAILAGAVLCRSIYYDFSLFAFAIAVAGAHVRRFWLTAVLQFFFYIL